VQGELFSFNIKRDAHSHGAPTVRKEAREGTGKGSLRASFFNVLRDSWKLKVSGRKEKRIMEIKNFILCQVFIRS